MKRKIININENKCTGCGLCVPDCPEGALQIIDGKARLVSDLFCDGLGACIGTCPEGAIEITEREGEPYNESLVMENIVKQGAPVIQAHLEHLASHGEVKLYNEAIVYLKKNNLDIPDHENGNIKSISGTNSGNEAGTCQGCPDIKINGAVNNINVRNSGSELKQWPVQLKLINPAAPYFDNADILITADCVPFAYGNFHNDFLKDKIVIMFCPKLDPYIDEYIEKLAAILSGHNINSITSVHMEVPCCGGVNYVMKQALEKSGKNIPIRDFTISAKGEIKQGSFD